MHPNSYSGHPCPYCRRLMDKRSLHLRPTRDHVIPRCRGGREKIVCCQKCNGLKADMLPDVWASYMAANPGWWLLTRAERRARRKQKQGSPPLPPVVVPPEFIYGTPS